MEEFRPLRGVYFFDQEPSETLNSKFLSPIPPGTNPAIVWTIPHSVLVRWKNKVEDEFKIDLHRCFGRELTVQGYDSSKCKWIVVCDCLAASGDWHQIAVASNCQAQIVLSVLCQPGRCIAPLIRRLSRVQAKSDKDSGSGTREGVHKAKLIRLRGNIFHIIRA